MQRQSALLQWAFCRPQPRHQTPWFKISQQRPYASTQGSQSHGTRSAAPNEKKTVPPPPLARPQPPNLRKLAGDVAKGKFRQGRPQPKPRQSRPQPNSRPREDPFHPSKVEGALTYTQSRGRNGERFVHLPPVIYPGDTNIIELPDGRVMSFAKIGRSDPNREMIPLVSEAGTPGTRLSSHLLHRWGRNMMIPIICPDRPGMGHSTYVKNYTVASHAQDVIFLMRALGYEKYRMYGTSGGGPFALAVAALVSQGEVIVTGIMAGSAPVEASRRGATYKRLWDEFVTTVFPWWRTMRMESAFSKANPNFKRDAIQVGHCQAKNNSERNKLATKEQYLRNGIKGYVQYWLAKNKYWGFELEAVGNKSPVHMVYGDRDSNTPLAGGLYMRERIGEKCKLVVIPNTNHSTSQQRGARALLDKLATYK